MADRISFKVGKLKAKAGRCRRISKSNLEVNLIGPFFLTRAALPALRQTKGRVINISTGAAVQPIFGWSAYCASKAGLTHFTKVLALEEPDLCSLAVRPGVVDTQMQEVIRKKGPNIMPPKFRTLDLWQISY